MSAIIWETFDAFRTQLCHTYLPTPKTPQEWRRISEEFSTLWNSPHCIGAGDGKHVVVDCLQNSCSNFSSTKVPLALFYCPVVMLITALQLLIWDNKVKTMTWVHFANSAIGKALKSISFNIPAAECVEGFADKLPWFL